MNKLTILLCTLALPAVLNAQFTYAPDEPLPEDAKVLGHNGLTYKVIRDWAKTDRKTAPLVNAHAMVEGKDGLFYLVTDHPENAVLVFKPDGTFVKGIGKGLKGGHGIDVIDIDGVEHLVHVDCGWAFSAEGKPKKMRGSVNILSKEGEVVRTLPTTQELGLSTEKAFYGPCDVAVTREGDILVIDGYGSQVIMHFDQMGKLIRHWPIPPRNDPGRINGGHGISIDHSDPKNPVVWVSSRSENKLKRFSLEGKYLGTVDLPGAYVGQAVLKGDYLYAAACWSKKPETGKKFGRSGFVVVMDRNSQKVISVPGGSKPEYDDAGKLKPLYQTHKVIKHGHDLMVDSKGNIFVMEWNAGRRYPYKLERISSGN